MPGAGNTAVKSTSSNGAAPPDGAPPNRIRNSSRMNDMNVSIAPADFRKAGFKEGFKVSTGVMPGMAAWGLVTGMAMVQSGLTLWQALGMTFVVYAGSAQLAALPLIAAGVPIWVIFVTSIVVNLRFVIFAAAIA